MEKKSGSKLFSLSSLFTKKQPPKSKNTEPSKNTKNEETSLKKEDIDAVKDTYDLIIDLMKDNNPDIEKTMLDQYEAHLKNINLDLSIKIKHGTPPHIINTHVNNAKYNLFEICMKKLMEYLSNVDGRLLNVLGRINDAHNSIIKNLTSNFFFYEDGLNFLNLFFSQIIFRQPKEPHTKFRIQTPKVYHPIP